MQINVKTDLTQWIDLGFMKNTIPGLVYDHDWIPHFRKSYLSFYTIQLLHDKAHFVALTNILFDCCLRST